MNPTDLENPCHASEEREAVAVGAGGEATAPGSAGAGPSEARPLSLDLESNNSPRAFLMPCHRGGKLDYIGGQRERYIDLDRFEALANFIRRGVFLTLTINRANFYGPREAYRVAMPLVSKLMRRLGFVVWGRVLEFHKKTGDGWVHWHVVADAAGTRWCRGGWVDLSALSREAWRLWRDVWGVGGCDLKRVKSRKGVGGYMAKYLTKGTAVLPPWVLAVDRSPRLVGFSRKARALIRRALNEPPPVKSERKGPEKKARSRRHALLDRLAWSGLCCTIIYRDENGRGHYCGTVVGRPCDIINHAAALPWVVHSVREVKPGRRRFCLDVEGGDAREVRHRVKLINATLACFGVSDAMREIAAQRRTALLTGWEAMQARFDAVKA